MDERQSILNFSRRELASELAGSFALPPFRARQLMQWVYRRRVTDFEEMTDISKSVRSDLESRYHARRPEIATVQQSRDGTRKYAIRLADGNIVESVLIKQPTRWTLCVSSQVGCAIGCKFCMTATMGLKRNLETAEIIGQILKVQDDIADLQANDAKTAPDFFQNIVFMGMGEPLHNLQNVVRAVTILNDQLGFNFTGRKITVSTSGLVKNIQAFGESSASANLAISLNATTDEVRDIIMPINKKWPLKELIATLKAYPLKRGRRITIEYVMLHGVNDTKDDLKRLPILLRGVPSKVNLIPYNSNSGLGFDTPPHDWVHHWQQHLIDAGMNSTIRWSKGLDIDAACGQLVSANKLN